MSRYFLIGTNRLFTSAPVIMNWFDKIDIKSINIEHSNRLPNRLVLPIKSNAETVFPDVIAKPFFLVSQKVHDVILMYQPKTVFKEIILLDSINGLVGQYFLPILKEYDCLSDKSEINLDRSVVAKAILKEELLPEDAIFKIGSLSNLYIVVRLDFMESVLRRGVRGIELSVAELDLSSDGGDYE
ncbi:hypothetical protein [Anaeromicropila populeti]|uniref:Uncharacterized protein n=1 Tax=Anaeromicropila populeti TaxID=37658 RepID=A0A1I6KN69_9FIRM|nr:hypothetical protein [Anaeromicropila populeti]SFR92360.1 hypothetical protein SAMN05661086_02540 [Anaeromicropila populeti]